MYSVVVLSSRSHLFFFFFNDTATTEIYTLSLHDALPISSATCTPPPTRRGGRRASRRARGSRAGPGCAGRRSRSEEHTSELQSRQYLVCRLLLEKKKKIEKQRDCQSNIFYHDTARLICVH